MFMMEWRMRNISSGHLGTFLDISFLSNTFTPHITSLLELPWRQELRGIFVIFGVKLSPLWA